MVKYTTMLNKNYKGLSYTWQLHESNNGSSFNASFHHAFLLDTCQRCSSEIKLAKDKQTMSNSYQPINTGLFDIISITLLYYVNIK